MIINRTTVIIDYDTGNLCSLGNAIARLGCDYIITADPNIIRSAGRVILPGVGEASSAMIKLRERGLDLVLKELTTPVLGICIGMQLMCSYSEEGNTSCIGIFPNRVIKLSDNGESALKGENFKIPHMGWNRIAKLSSPLFSGLKEGEYQYFVHSYAPEILTNTVVKTIAQTNYGIGFASALNLNNFYGTQFHPEKSGSGGELILKNFLNL